MVVLSLMSPGYRLLSQDQLCTYCQSFLFSTTDQHVLLLEDTLYFCSELSRTMHLSMTISQYPNYARPKLLTGSRAMFVAEMRRLLTGSTFKSPRWFSQDSPTCTVCELLTGINMQEELSSQGQRGTRNFSQYQHARGHYTHQELNMQEELLTGSTCKRNFSQDQHATRNFSQYQHAPGTSHRNNMQEELLTESTCKRTFWSAYGCFSFACQNLSSGSKCQYHLYSYRINLFKRNFHHRINMFSYELFILFTFKLWIVSRGKTQDMQKRHYTHHPLNFHFCHLFLTIIIKFHPALSLFLVSTTVNCFLTFNTFTSAIGPYFPSIVQQPL